MSKPFRVVKPAASRGRRGREGHLNRKAACRTAGILLAATLWAFLPVEAFAQSEPAQPPAEEPIALESSSESDEAVERRLRGIFEELPEFRDLQLDVNAGVVTLRGTVAEPEAIETAERLAKRVTGVALVRNAVELTTSVEDQLAPALERLSGRLRLSIDRLPLFGVALLVFAVFVTAGLWVARREAPWNRLAPNAFVADLLRHIARLVFIVAGLVIALEIFGATALLGSILGAAGIAGLALGFAVKDTIENYIASIMLSIRQPFRPNDHVKIEEYEGLVIRLTSRATILMTFNGNHVRIPNASVYKGVIVNYTRNPERRFEFVLGVDADSDLKRAITIGLELLRDLDFVLYDPEPLAAVQDVGDSNVLLWFAGWIDQRVTDFAKARGEAIRLTKGALEDAGFGLPEPIYRVRLFNEIGEVAQERPLPAPAARMPDRTAEPEADTAKDETVTEKVATERARADQEDLLDPAGQTE